jgi:hypothetical protein
VAHLTTKAAVLLTAPELVSVPDDRFDQALSDVDLEVDPAFFGTQAERAARLLSAHLLTVQGKGSQAGALQSITVGPMTKTFAQASGEGAGVPQRFAGSSYGVEYYRLLRLFGAGPVLVRS